MQRQCKELESRNQQQLEKVEEQSRQNREEVEAQVGAQVESRVREVRKEMQSQVESYVKKAEFVAKKGEEVQASLQKETRSVQSLSEKIEGHYLKEMQAQKKRIEELGLTLDQTHELMANDAKEKKQLAMELQELKKGGKKK